jgi:hypothetical protein
LISTTSGRTRWIVSAAFFACWLFGVDRSAISCPAALLLSEALKVAKRASSGLPPRLPPSATAAGTSTSAAASDAISAIRI